MNSKIVSFTILALISLTSIAERGMIKGVLSGINEGWDLTLDNNLKLSIIDVDKNLSADEIWADIVDKYGYIVYFNAENKTIFMKKSLTGVGEIFYDTETMISPVVEEKKIDSAEIERQIVLEGENKRIEELKRDEVKKSEELQSKIKEIEKNISEIITIGANVGLVGDKISEVKEILSNFSIKDIAKVNEDKLITIIRGTLTQLQKEQNLKLGLVLNKIENLSMEMASNLNKIKEIDSDISHGNNYSEDTILSINSLLNGIADNVEINKITNGNNRFAIDIGNMKQDLHSKNINELLLNLQGAIGKEIKRRLLDVENNKKSMDELYAIIEKDLELVALFKKENLDYIKNMKNENDEMYTLFSKKLKSIEDELGGKFAETQGIIINIAKSIKKDIEKQFDYLEKLSSMMEINSKIIAGTSKLTVKSNNKVISAITGTKQDATKYHGISMKKINKIAEAVEHQNTTIDKINKENELIRRTRGESDVVVRLLINSLFDVSEAKGMIVTDVFSRKTELRHINIHIGTMKLKYGGHNNKIIRNKDIKLTLNEAGLIKIEGIRGSDEAYFLINRWYHEKYKQLISSNVLNRFQTQERKLSVKFDINSKNQTIINDMRSIGKAVYETNCYNCHESGFGGAVGKNNLDFWNKYRESTTLKMAKQALDSGVGRMPKKGSCYSCSTNELSEAIKYLTGIKR